ncbi:Cold-shock DNA-binding domain-containing protein [Aphelenchoides bicaudatus]|nr:Cold-shock DNA-binding domain-containing protein [Aphelenchoides bicaudatus]
MTEKAVEGKKGKAQVPVAKPGANVKAKEAPKGSNGSSSEKKSSNSSSENGSNGDHPERAHEKKGPPSAEDLERYKKYVGQKWTGRCRWFNVMKGFGFIDPHFEEAKSNNDDVFVHQSALQMEGFRSLDENEEVEFVVSLGRNGLEAAEVQGIDGATLRGHSIRPMGRKNRERLIRCFKCGKLGHHQASRCKVEIAPKACYQCHSTEHQVSNCPTYLARKEAQAEGKSSRPSKPGQKPAAK